MVQDQSQKEVVANLGKAKKGPIVKYNSKVKIRA